MNTVWGNEPQFQAALKAEVDAFNLPENWQVGREVLHGYAIDQPYSNDKDDAIATTRTPDDQAHLLVSVADTGTMLKDSPAIHAAARRARTSRYFGTMVKRSMIHPSISEDKLSLLDEVPRPVLTARIPLVSDMSTPDVVLTRDVLMATDLSQAAVNKNLSSKKPDPALIRLSSLAYDLSGLGQDDDGPEIEHTPARDIVERTMILANMAVALYMAEEGIPALFLVRHPHYQNSHYSADPEDNKSPDMPIYTHFTSPLRRFADLVNHANVVAHLTGEPPVYPIDEITKIAGEINKPSQLAPIRLMSPKKKAPPKPQPVSPRVLEATASHITKKIEETPEEITINHLSRVLLGSTIGELDEVATARQAAFDYLVQRPILFKGVIGTAFQQGWLEREWRNGEQSFTHENSDLKLRGRSGRPHKFPVEQGIEFISDILGIKPTVEIGEMQAPEEIAPDTDRNTLNELNQQGSIHYVEEFFQPKGSGGHTAQLYAFVNGHLLSAEHNDQSKTIARNTAATNLAAQIADLSEPPANILAYRNQEYGVSPREQLRTYVSEQGLADPIFEYESLTEPIEHTVCTATITDKSGTEVTISVAAAGKKVARQTAAAALLKQLK